MVVRFLNIKRNKFLKVIIIFAGISVILFIIYFPNYTRLKKLKNEDKVLTERIKKLQDEINNLRNLQSNSKPSFLEKKVREELGLAREGEIIIDIKE